MTNPNKRKGDKAEREAAELLTEVTGFQCKRNLSAGIICSNLSIKFSDRYKKLMNPNKRKGDKAEREAAELLTKVTGFQCKRNLAAGIPDDVGDIYGIPNCVVQVCDYKDKSRACLVKPREVETQRKNAGVDFVASMVRFRGGEWRVVLTPEQFNTLLQSALQ